MTIAAILCAASLIVMVFSLLQYPSQSDQPFQPPDFDGNACRGEPQVPPELGWCELDAQVYRVSVCGNLIPQGNSVDIWLTNPEENDVWLKLRVLDINGEILGETGLITPGQYIQRVFLDFVPETDTPVILKIMAYEPETYYSAGSISLNTHIY